MVHIGGVVVVGGHIPEIIVIARTLEANVVSGPSPNTTSGSAPMDSTRVATPLGGALRSPTSMMRRTVVSLIPRIGGPIPRSPHTVIPILIVGGKIMAGTGLSTSAHGGSSSMGGLLFRILIPPPPIIIIPVQVAPIPTPVPTPLPIGGCPVVDALLLHPCDVLPVGRSLQLPRDDLQPVDLLVHCGAGGRGGQLGEHCVCRPAGGNNCLTEISKIDS